MPEIKIAVLIDGRHHRVATYRVATAKEVVTALSQHRPGIDGYTAELHMTGTAARMLGAYESTYGGWFLNLGDGTRPEPVIIDDEGPPSLASEKTQ